MSPAEVLRVAVPSPLRRTFDYLPATESAHRAVPGVRVKVPFGRRSCIGVVVSLADGTDVPRSKLRRITEVLDPEPLFPADSLAFLTWAAAYFHHPIGEVILGALPGDLRGGKHPGRSREGRWRLTESGQALTAGDLKRARRQAMMVECLRGAGGPVGTGVLLAGQASARTALNELVRKGFVESAPDAPQSLDAVLQVNPSPAAGPALNDAQASVVSAVVDGLDAFRCFLLDGVTGSGKTEVYLSVIDEVLAAGRQALVLIPEIGLTPQLEARFRARVGSPLVVLHSALAGGERALAWLAAQRGEARVVIGTRSSVFVPLPDLGVVIVDEEHDLSYKQQDGFRYSARDLAVVRGQRAGVPVLLGSATPSLESLHNAERGRYHDLRLPERAGDARPPDISIIDLRGLRMRDGVSDPLLRELEANLERGEQSLLFINRRGFAPTLFCRACGWHGQCPRCDANLVLHRHEGRLRCHHCGLESRLPETCPDCDSEKLEPMGTGTQRIDEAIAERFPAARVERLDRDRLRRRGSLESVLARARDAEIDILVGTQMLAKGHDFPGVTLVGIVDGDGGLFGADFRAPERMAQLLVQVAGRAGRGDRAGRVLLQTHHPHHPLLRTLIASGYRAFARECLAERELACLPPFHSTALLRAEAAKAEVAQRFLTFALGLAQELAGEAVSLLGPVPAPMERRAGRFRAHLLLESPARAPLHRLLGPWMARLEGSSEGRKVRWSLDVDPQEML